MTGLLRPVRYGMLIGLLGLVFGMGWAIWLVVGHERIHKSFEIRMLEGAWYNSAQPLAPGDVHAHGDEEKPPTEESSMRHDGMPVDEEGSHQHETREPKPHFEGGHENPIMEISHTRLRWAHIHYMGLGLLTLILSVVLAFTSASARIQGITSVLTGLGGVIYPFAWIVMGYRTPSLGANAAMISAAAIAGPGIALVLLGILTTAFFLLRDIFSSGRSAQAKRSRHDVGSGPAGP